MTIDSRGRGAAPPQFSFRAGSSGSAALLSITLLLSLCRPSSAYEAEPNMCLADASATFTASPPVIEPGQNSVLSWAVDVPYGCSLQVKVTGIGIVSRTGSLTVSPQTPATTYQLSVSLARETRTLKSITVTVRDPAAYTSATAPPCTGTQIATHDWITANQHRVDVVDPVGEFIGSSEGDGELWRNWEPINQHKEEVCGTMHHYGYHVGSWYNYAGEEADANKYIIPSPSYAHRIFDAVAANFTQLGDLHTCGGEYCMEAEITADEHYFSGWFPAQAGPTLLDGKPFCAYGPWVADHGHDGRPEIHTGEANWWPLVPTPAGMIQKTIVALFQDDSNRYDDRVDDFVPDMPSHIKPWSAAPMKNYVRYAFRVRRSGGTEEFLHISHPERYRNISTASGFPGDVTSGNRHALKFDGVPRFTVVEPEGALDYHLSVAFDDDLTTRHDLFDVCTRDDGTLQGYALLRTQYGVDNSGGEGFQELVLQHTTQASLTTADTRDLGATDVVKTSGSTPIKASRADFDSAHLGEDGHLRGDLIVRLDGSASLDQVVDGKGNPIRWSTHTSQTGGDETGVRLYDVDFSSGIELEALFSDGRSYRAPLPGLAVAFELSGQAKIGAGDAKSLDAAWREWIRSLGIGPSRRPDAFARIAAWEFDVTPQFAAIKDGEPSLEDEHGMTGFLNRKSHAGDTHAILTLSSAMQKLQWVVDGSTVSLADNRLHHTLRMPVSDSVSERVVQARLIDRFGHDSTRNAKVSSHVLQIDAPDAMRTCLADILAVDGPLLEPVNDRLPHALRVQDARNSYRGLLDQTIRRAVRDGVVTSDELRAQIFAARKLLSPH